MQYNPCVCENYQTGNKVPLIWEKISADIQPINLEYFNTHSYKQENFIPAEQMNAYTYPQDNYEQYPENYRGNSDDGLYTILKDGVPILTFSSNLDYLAAVRQPENEAYHNLPNVESYPHPSANYENSYEPTPEYKNDYQPNPDLIDKTDSTLEKARISYKNQTRSQFNQSDLNGPTIETEKITQNIVNKTNLQDNDKSFSTTLHETTTANIKQIEKSDDIENKKHNSTGRESEHYNVPMHILSKDNNYGFTNTKFEKRETGKYYENDKVNRVQISIGLNQNEVCTALKNIGISCNDVFHKMCNEKQNSLTICDGHK